MIYLDSSALVKLALTEPESAALARWLAERADQPLVSSALHRAEVPRAVWRAEPGALPRSYRLIKRIARVALTADVLDNSATLAAAGTEPGAGYPPILRAGAEAGPDRVRGLRRATARRGQGRRAAGRLPRFPLAADRACDGGGGERCQKTARSA